MRLETLLIPGWPKLAWVATAQQGADVVRVRHGPMVEVASDWIVEAVWAGDFAVGDFDRTELVFGTGVRVRGDAVVFVNSGMAVDRLWCCRRGSTWVVSNSLPALLATTGLAPRQDYRGYRADLATVEFRGTRSYVPTIPMDGGDVRVVYLQDLRYDGRTLAEVDKPDTAPHFACFDDYERFLIDVARRVEQNINSPDRARKVEPLVAISSGYDSPATAVVARHAGCSRAVTLVNSTSLWRGSDSGLEIARHLGLTCQAYSHDPSAYRRETTIWAAAAKAGGLNFTLFDYPEPLCLLFDGSYGDKVWDRFHHDLSEPVGDVDSLLCEYRLFQGVFHTVVPWWGIRRAQEINALGKAPEMAPWTLHTKYDRPVARRFVEEAGVPREAFGIRKKNTSANVAFLWPRTAEGQASFARYLRDKGCYVPSGPALLLLRLLTHWDGLVHRNITRRLGLRKGLRHLLAVGGSTLVFHWANEELKTHYLEGLHSADVEPAQVLAGEQT